jgi:hypothetical protein
MTRQKLPEGEKNKAFDAPGPKNGTHWRSMGPSLRPSFFFCLAALTPFSVNMNDNPSCIENRPYGVAFFDLPRFPALLGENGTSLRVPDKLYYPWCSRSAERSEGFVFWIIFASGRGNCRPKFGTTVRGFEVEPSQRTFCPIRTRSRHGVIMRPWLRLFLVWLLRAYIMAPGIKIFRFPASLEPAKTFLTESHPSAKTVRGIAGRQEAGALRCSGRPHSQKGVRHHGNGR